jgi:hypothetical protein
MKLETFKDVHDLDKWQFTMSFGMKKHNLKVFIASDYDVFKWKIIYHRKKIEVIPWKVPVITLPTLTLEPCKPLEPLGQFITTAKDVYHITETDYTEIIHFLKDKYGMIMYSSSDKEPDVIWKKQYTTDRVKIEIQSIEEFNADEKNHWQEPDYQQYTNDRWFTYTTDTWDWQWHWPTIDQYLSYVEEVKKKNKWPTTCDVIYSTDVYLITE